MARERHVLQIIADTREQDVLFRARRDGRVSKGGVVAEFTYTPPGLIEVPLEDVRQAINEGNPYAQTRLKNRVASALSGPVCESPAIPPEAMTEFPGWVRGAKYKQWDVTVECATLATGDYSLKGLESAITIDRKSGLPELASNFSVDRERFEREFERMRTYEVALIVVESGSLDQLEAYYTGGMSPRSLRNSILAWQAKYRVPFVFPGSRAKAQEYILEELVRFAERKESELQRLAEAAKEML